MDRRSLLKLAGASLALPWTAGRAMASEEAEAVFVLLEGLAPEMGAARLEAFVTPFLDHGIPLAFLPDLAPPPGGGGGGDGAAYLAFLLSRHGHRVELVAPLPPLSGLTSYLQRRRASDALAALRRRLGVATPPEPGAEPLTAATRERQGSYDTLRALGLRNVLALEEGAATASLGCSERAVCLVGSTGINPWTATGRLAALAAGRGPVLLRLGLAGLGERAPEEVRRRGEELAEAIGGEVSAGRRFAVLPREHAAWMAGYQPRLASILVRTGGADGPAAGLAELAEALDALGLPHSVAGAPAATGPDCLDLDAAATGAALDWLAARGAGSRVCVAGRGAAGVAETLAPDLLVVPDAPASFDDRAILTRGSTPLAGFEALLGGGRMRDGILALGPADYATPPARWRTLERLRRLARAEGTLWLPLDAFAERVLSPDPLLDLHRRTRRTLARPDPPDGDPGPERLMRDAALAWTFFQRFSLPETGLCVDTVHETDGGLWQHQELTMWDLGSLIAAVMAAHELGLIDDATYAARAALMARALPQGRIAGRRLPAAVISSRSALPLSEDFNACDTGRLLSVLREFDAYPLSRGLAAEAVAGWEFAGVLVGGRLHSLVGGRLVDRHGSHCTHYAARALRSWGHAVSSPYEGTGDLSPADRQMELLHAVAGIGPYGAEPLLTEGIEMGLSAPADFLADVLFAAQRRAFEEREELRAVSEGPLDRAPWFSYQGLDVNAAGDGWAVLVPSSDPAHHSAAFRREVELVNTKAAFLWAALRPGAHSARLWAHVSERARIEGMGFSPGVFAASGHALPGYSDVNTNALVLQAVAFILRGRRPRLPPGDAP